MPSHWEEKNSWLLRRKDCYGKTCCFIILIIAFNHCIWCIVALQGCYFFCFPRTPAPVPVPVVIQPLPTSEQRFHGHGEPDLYMEYFQRPGQPDSASIHKRPRSDVSLLSRSGIASQWPFRFGLWMFWLVFFAVWIVDPV